tara:strand:+ start:132 stop:326 length:195 start_codon:yes stop_codon:yes gene_type:complete
MELAAILGRYVHGIVFDDLGWVDYLFRGVFFSICLIIFFGCMVGWIQFTTNMYKGLKQLFKDFK